MTTALQSGQVRELLELARFGKRFGTKLVTGVVGISVVLGGFAWYLVSQVHGIDTRLASLSTAFEGHRNTHNQQWSHGNTKGDSVAPDRAPVEELPAPNDNAEPLPKADNAPEAPMPTPAPPVSAPPPSLTKVRVGPPICVNPKTKKKFSCDDVADEGCYPDGFWHPNVTLEAEQRYPGSRVSLCPPK